MKKFLALFIAFTLFTAAFAFLASADEPIYDFASTANAIIINGTTGGEQVNIVTKQDSLADANLKWTINIVLEKVSNNVYKVKSVAAGDGNVPAVTLGSGEILLGVHSSSNKMEDIASYQNVPGKIAAASLVAGNFITFTNIDLTAGTVGTSPAIVATAEAPDDVSTPDPTSPAVEVSNEPSEEPDTSSEDTSSQAPASSVPAESSEGTSSVATTDDTDEDSNLTTYLIIAAAVVVVAVVAFVIVKKKK